MEGYIKIGKAGKSVGLKGYVSINLIPLEKDALTKYSRIFFSKNDSLYEYEIEDYRIDKPRVVKLSGVDNRIDSDALKGLDVFVAKEDIEELLDDEYYLGDLVGLSVFENGVLRGEVSDVKNFGASDIIDIALKDGNSVMLPLIEGVVKEVNIKEKKIFVENIDDYI